MPQDIVRGGECSILGIQPITEVNNASKIIYNYILHEVSNVVSDNSQNSIGSKSRCIQCNIWTHIWILGPEEWHI